MTTYKPARGQLLKALETWAAAVHPKDLPKWRELYKRVRDGVDAPESESDDDQRQ